MSPDKTDGCSACNEYCRFRTHAGVLYETVDLDAIDRAPETIHEADLWRAEMDKLARVRASIQQLAAEARASGCPNVDSVLGEYNVQG